LILHQVLPKLLTAKIAKEDAKDAKKYIYRYPLHVLGEQILVETQLGRRHQCGTVPWAIATSGRRASACPMLELLQLAPSALVVTRDEVQHAKPDPDLFLAAAHGLGISIHDSVVVGDSIWDLLAARRARALGVGLLSGGYGQDELERAGAYRVYQDPSDLLRHLDEVGFRSIE